MSSEEIIQPEKIEKQEKQEKQKKQEKPKRTKRIKKVKSVVLRENKIEKDDLEIIQSICSCHFDVVVFTNSKDLRPDGSCGVHPCNTCDCKTHQFNGHCFNISCNYDKYCNARNCHQ